MTKTEWLNQVIEHKDKLAFIVAAYHPSSGQTSSKMPITAVNAERMCAGVRKAIKDNLDYIFNPAFELFEEAILNKDTNTISRILSETWVGVPESRDCWGINGFKELVDLLDDPIEES